MRGALTPPPSIDEPVMKMPLDPPRSDVQSLQNFLEVEERCRGEFAAQRRGERREVVDKPPYHAAPTTDRPMQSPIPIDAQA